MKKLCFIFSLLFIMSCREKEDLIPYEPYIESNEPLDDTQEAVRQIYREYNSKIIFDWDRRYIETNVSSTPPKYEIIQPYVENVIRKLFIAPYDKQNSDFMRENMPIEIVLFGTTMDYMVGERGFSATGGARSLSRILMTGVNRYDLTDRNWLESQAILFAHELAHILDKKYGRPIGFDAVSEGLYAGTASTGSFSATEVRRRGFWRSYGMLNQTEDYGTWVEGIVSTPKDQMLLIVAENERMSTKYRLVYNHYLKMGIDLHVLRDNILNTINNFNPIL